MWLVERVRDDGYEGETKVPLFVSNDETFAKDWAEAAEIEISAVRLMEKPKHYRFFLGMKKEGGGTYGKEDYDAEMAVYFENARKVMVLDTYAENNILEYPNNHSYEVTEVPVQNPPATG